MNRIFIANRGEIAFRVSRTCQAMGIQSQEMKAQETRSYLDIDGVIQAAREAKCDAIHPGYGFLSENPQFAQACEKTGISFIGPTSKSMRALGDKAAAKDLAQKLKIPTLESIHETQIIPRLAEEIQKQCKLPVLLKPIAGGGGKGMVPVLTKSDLPSSIERARQEAKTAFGDERLLVEPYLQNPRHVEVQIAADQKGHAVALYERDCSLQRRHQKVVEESPSPFLNDGERKQLYDAAIRLCQAAHYSNLGTVEFLLDSKGNFYFMEVNTRLQVEHPVTEMRTGMDLVELQIRLAQGASIDSIKIPKPSGHTLECRVYAEDPGHQFLPATGKLLRLKWPKDGARIDTGIESGTNITHEFDPLLCKIIVAGKNRNEAFQKMDGALSETVLLGVTTNLNFLRWITTQPEVLHAKHHTSWIESHISEYQAWEKKLDWDQAHAIVEKEKSSPTHVEVEDDDIWRDNPFDSLGTWRMRGLS